MLFKDLSKQDQKILAVNLLATAYNYYGTNAEAEDLALSAGSLAADLSSIPNLKADELEDLFTQGRKKHEVFKCSPFIIFKIISAEKAAANKQDRCNGYPMPEIPSEEIIRARQIDFASSVVIPYLDLLSSRGLGAVADTFPFIPASVIYDFILKHKLSEITLEDNDYQDAIHELEMAANHAGYFEGKNIKSMIASLVMPQQSRDLSFRAKAYALQRFIEDEAMHKYLLSKLDNFINHV